MGVAQRNRRGEILSGLREKPVEDAVRPMAGDDEDGEEDGGEEEERDWAFGDQRAI